MARGSHARAAAWTLKRPCLWSALATCLTLLASPLLAQPEAASDTAPAADAPAAPSEPAEPTGPGDPSTPVDPDARLIADLGAPDFGVREAAYFELLRQTAVNEQRMLRWMKRADSPEARHRVLSAARHHVLRNLTRDQFDGFEAGSVGLTQQVLLADDAPDLRRAAVLVVMTFPGFPAYAHLKPGDLIVQFDGQPIPDRMTVEMFRDMVQQHQNGDRISLIAIRQGQPVKLSFELGSFEALRQMYQHNDRSLQPPFSQAWQQVRDQLIQAAPPIPQERIEGIEGQ